MQGLAGFIQAQHPFDPFQPHHHRPHVRFTMARGAAAKLRRRANRAKGDDDPIDMFGTDDGEEEEDTDLPMPPSMQKATPEDDFLPKKSKKKLKKPPTAAPPSPVNGSGGLGGLGSIKRGPLILLVLLTGTTLLPALIYASDYLGGFMAKNNVIGSLGFRLGLGSVPRKRVTSFYEKHAPEKMEEVPHILGKYYGDYSTLIKRLERKYQDYGYFIGWEEDEAPMTLALDQLRETYQTWVTEYWNRYAPQVLKTAARNIRYNLTTLYRKFRKVWKKHIWPMLEPFLGVPDGVEKQKRKDAAEARKRAAAGGMNKATRRKNTDFRDDEEE